MSKGNGGIGSKEVWEAQSPVRQMCIHHNPASDFLGARDTIVSRGDPPPLLSLGSPGGGDVGAQRKEVGRKTGRYEDKVKLYNTSEGETLQDK